VSDATLDESIDPVLGAGLPDARGKYHNAGISKTRSSADSMGRGPKNPMQITSKKQLPGIKAVCAFLGGIGDESPMRLRNGPNQCFPKPLQHFSNTPLWSIDQIENFVVRKEKEIEML
jgi:hypothetical protein